MANEEQPQTTPHTRLFHSVAAAEDAYRQELQRNEVLATKLDVKFDELGRTIGGKLDSLGDKFDELTSLLKQVLLANTSAASAPPAVPPAAPSLTSLTPPLAPPKPESTSFDLPPPATDTVTGLRALNLARSQSDPEVNPRRAFLQRDRSLPPQSQSPTRIPIQPFLRHSPSPSRQETSYKPMNGIKLPSFHGRYTEDVNAWIIIIEDRFYLHETREDKKIAEISALLEDDARSWYLNLKKLYPRPPSWEEFKMELRVKFADSPIRLSYLRRTLKAIEYGGPSEMEQYVAQFRSIEIQISEDDMKFGDKLQYFIAPFGTTLKRKIVYESPKRLEIAYDSALEYANAYLETQKTSENVEKKQAKSLLNSTTATAAQKREASKDKDSDSASDTGDELDAVELKNWNTQYHTLMAAQMREITCFRCQKVGHYAENCPAPYPVSKTTRPPYRQRNGYENTRSKARFKPTTDKIHEGMYMINDDDDSGCIFDHSDEESYEACTFEH